MARTQYVLSKQIARGGMAEIFLGKIVGVDGFQKICAIKRILPQYAEDKEFLAMFRLEANVCKGLQHANIVQVMDFKEVEGCYALIMEYVDGTDLRTILSACEVAGVRLSTPMAIYIAAQAARGLHYAHVKIDPVTGRPLNLIHRDISPQNLLIGYEGDVKVIDFGIADFDSKSVETRPGVVKGKYSYMSPEQIVGKPLDARTDVFSLAIVLWESLAMRRLFAGSNDMETIRNVQSCKIKHSVRDLNGEVDDELNAILMKGLAADKNKRFLSAAAFEKALLKYLNFKYPDFNASDLGNFLKQLLAKKRAEIHADMREILTNIQEPSVYILDGNTGSASRASLSGSGSSIPAPQNSVFSLDSSDGSLPTPVSTSSSPSLGGSASPVGSSNVVTATSRNFQYSTAYTGRANYYKANVKKVSFFSKFISWLVIITLTIVTGSGLAVVSKKFKLMSLLEGSGRDDISKYMEIQLSVVPPIVSLALEGKMSASSKEVRTPTKFKVPAGKYQLTIVRAGYVSKSLEITGRAGEVIGIHNVVLEKANAVSKSNSNHIVYVQTKSGRPVYVTVDQEYFEGMAPAKIPGLLPNTSHIATFYPNHPRTGGEFSCRFKTTSNSVTTLIVEPSENSCMLSN